MKDKNWIESHPFKMALFISLFVGGFAMLFHNIHYNPNDWYSFFLWLPAYISPIWGIAGVSFLSERGKE